MKDQVVYADDDLSAIIPIYTSDNVFYSADAELFFLTDKEVENRFIINHYFDTFTPEYVLSNQRSIFGGYYINQFGHTRSEDFLKKLLHLPYPPNQLLPQTVINSVISDAQKIQQNNLTTEIKTYKIDYLIWDSVHDPKWLVPKTYKLLYSSDGIFIYKVI